MLYAVYVLTSYLRQTKLLRKKLYIIMLAGLPMKRFAILIIVTFLVVGCKTIHRDTRSLAIIELGYKDRTELVYLANDYGFLILWIDHQKPQFYLYNKPANKIQMTGSFSDFLSGLQAFPNGVKVDRIRGCGITEQGMPENYKEQLFQIIKDKKFYLTDIEDGNFTVCECETTYVRRFNTTNKSIQGTR